MSTQSPLAGKAPPRESLVDVTKLIAQYYANVPDPSVVSQRVSFGTSGHRGSSLETSFNEGHVLAITQAICDYRVQNRIDGPLFIGIDTHALSKPAFDTALEVLAGNGVETMIAADDEYTPTPAVSLAILTHNRDRTRGLADGIVVTPSHNPPESGGFKYNSTNGGPADTDATRWIEVRANALLADSGPAIKRISLERARRAATTHSYDFVGAYVEELGNVIDMQLIRASGIRMGVDPLGGAGVHYWPRIAQHYGVNLTVVSDRVDPTFSFMTLDWDGRIRMDPSSSFAMRSLIAIKDSFDIAFACDTDHDRHGIVTHSGLMQANHYLAVAIEHLFRTRTAWDKESAVGKTIVSSSMIDRVAAGLNRQLVEVPVGFKWFVDGLVDGSLGFGGEESAGASFLRRNGTVWTTDKDGIAPALLAAEVTASAGYDPGDAYHRLTQRYGNPSYRRVEAPATAAQKKRLATLSAAQVQSSALAGDAIERVLTTAPFRDAPFGGVKVVTAQGWFAARPSGTEDVYKIYAESFRGDEHLQRIVDEAQAIVSAALTT